MVLSHVIWGHPGGLFQFSGGGAVRIIFASIKIPHLFALISSSFYSDDNLSKKFKRHITFTKQHLGTAWSAACPALVDPVQQHVYPIPPVYAAIHPLPTVSEQPTSETTAAVWLALLRPSNQHAETISTLPPE